MIKNIDHVTVAVTNLLTAKEFFSHLGFVEERSVIIEGERFANYMHIKNLKADHVTLVLQDSNPRFEIQLLHFYSPEPQYDPYINRLDKVGYNHICFVVDDIEFEIEKLKSNGVRIISDILSFHKRKLVYIEGPDGIIVELAQW
ncbi:MULTISPECIES: VOC family protein [Legionella]|mgnify:CR=1 FL=1|uniref:Metallothiol transferase FosB n=1 Tax=Legionella steelei TaxID=947033 RepID=A0A0W0ZI63_9GAMM|nr:MULTISPECIES: VOC family protein [Legionella]KTD68680.1 Metallothiol transferase FosB [Legionella steelei]MBN9226711.1 VOC family protein [Legionella steelei]OJW06734.1 MAG: glyoxalase [Legionella sp. 39-23]